MEGMEDSAFLISIIIPVLNEVETINTTLAHLRRPGQGVDFEIIVVDGDSSGNTLKVVNDPDVVKVRSSKGRGLQMNKGAIAANGEALVFLHSDTVLPDNAAIAIRTAVIKEKTLHIQAGAGVVADSLPELEWKETMNKGRAVFLAVAMAEAGIDRHTCLESGKEG